jgi:hypothetical protein
MEGSHVAVAYNGLQLKFFGKGGLNMKRGFVLGIAIFLLAAGALVISLMSCGGGGGSSGGSSTGSTGTGTVAMLLSDGPADEYRHIWITVTEVSLLPANGNAGPVVIFSSPAGVRVDLLGLRNEDFLLTIRNNVPAGLYNKIRLGVSKIEPEGGPCADMMVKLPSGKIDLDPREPFQVKGGGTLAIRLDIDANKSINLHQAGNSGKCIFRPVVFVDIQEGVPTARCPKVLNGTIASLKLSGSSQVAGFTLNLQDNRGTIEVSLQSNATVINSPGECASPNDLKVGDNVKVRGKLVNNAIFQASMVVVGDLLDVTGTVVDNPVFSDSTFTFDFTALAGQELVGQWTVQGQACTLTLTGCDTVVDPASIQEGMTVQIFGKLVSNNQSSVLRAAAIVLQGQEIAGEITSVTSGTGGKQVTILKTGGGSVTVFIPNGTPIYLEGDGAVPIALLCVGQQVRVFLNSSIPTPLTADLVKIQSEEHKGTVTAIDALSHTLTVDLGGGESETVYVEPGATILVTRDDFQGLISFEDIKVNDYMAYFGLLGCDADSRFHAFVIVITDPQA